MWIKVTIDGPDGRHTENAADVRKEGEIAKAVGDAVKDYRKTYPDAPHFDYGIKVSHT